MMNHTVRLKRAFALLVGLVLLLGAVVPSLAEEELETAPSAQQEQSEKKEPSEKTQDESEEIEQPEEEPPEAEQEQQEEEDFPEIALDEEEEKDEHTYGASWSEAAFSGQTVNYMDELILGVGVSIDIRPERDIELIVDGEHKPLGKQSHVRYESSNDRYITVNENGQLRTERKGSAQLLVTVELPDGHQKQLRKSIKVVDEPDIRFAPSFALLENGGKLDLGQYAKAPLLKASPNVDARVRYEIKPITGIGNGNSSVTLDAKTGKLQVAYEQPGDVYEVIAKTYAGKTAIFTLYLGGRADRLNILVPTGAVNSDGKLRIRAGETLALRATVFSENAAAARQDVAWVVESGADVASIDEGGILRIMEGITEEQLIRVCATTRDGSEIKASIEIIAAP